MNVFLGISASAGLCLGKAFVVPDIQKKLIHKNTISEDQKNSQWKRLEDAVAKISNQMIINLEESKAAKDKIQSAIYETYFLMLSDLPL